jgi:hypothetical protein
MGPLWTGFVGYNLLSLSTGDVGPLFKLLKVRASVFFPFVSAHSHEPPTQLGAALQERKSRGEALTPLEFDDFGGNDEIL